MSSQLKRGKKRKRSSGTGSESADEGPPSSKLSQEQEELSQEPVQESEPNLSTGQSMDYIIQFIDGVNVAPKQPCMAVAQQIPGNLQISVSPGTHTGITLPTMTSTAENTSEICMLPPKKRLASLRYVSRGTTITPDLKQPELRSDDLELGTGAEDLR